MDGVKVLTKDVATGRSRIGEMHLRKGLLYRGWKRVFDICLSCTALVCLSPIFLITIIAIRAEDGGPAFFTQIRTGKDRKPFKIYKFRSMRMDADKIHEDLRKTYNNTEVSFKLQDDPRVTKIGRIIRKFNIDELPQLINILAGSMSFVGPRPLPVYEYEEEQKRYGERYIRRYSVPQGLTCYWQISDRGKQSFETRMQQDVDYADHCCIKEDVKLIAKTFLYTICGRAGY
ncbi:MAG: sugar transferase [Lachnospiraceae bacterium]|nr:sugar transferase [Lachnospiraceae bacterium]